jgi:hypothetical protein
LSFGSAAASREESAVAPQMESRLLADRTGFGMTRDGIAIKTSFDMSRAHHLPSLAMSFLSHLHHHHYVHNVLAGVS